MSKPTLENVLAISTAHIPKSDPDFGKLTVMKFINGFIVFVTQEGKTKVSDSEVPSWLKPIMKLAVKHDCTLILFDADCCVNVDLLPVYDW